MPEPPALYASDVMTEAQLQQTILERAGQLGYLRHHDWQTGRKPWGRRHVRLTDEGYPDILLVGHGRIIAVECKKQDGRLSAAQQRWRQELLLAGCLTWVVRPSNLDAFLDWLEAL